MKTYQPYVCKFGNFFIFVNKIGHTYTGNMRNGVLQTTAINYPAWILRDSELMNSKIKVTWCAAARKRDNINEFKFFVLFANGQLCEAQFSNKGHLLDPWKRLSKKNTSITNCCLVDYVILAANTPETHIRALYLKNDKRNLICYDYNKGEVVEELDNFFTKDVTQLLIKYYRNANGKVFRVFYILSKDRVVYGQQRQEGWHTIKKLCNSMIDSNNQVILNTIATTGNIEICRLKAQAPFAADSNNTNEKLKGCFCRLGDPLSLRIGEIWAMKNPGLKTNCFYKVVNGVLEPYEAASYSVNGVTHDYCYFRIQKDDVLLRARKNNVYFRFNLTKKPKLLATNLETLVLSKHIENIFLDFDAKSRKGDMPYIETESSKNTMSAHNTPAPAAPSRKPIQTSRRERNQVKNSYDKTGCLRTTEYYGACDPDEANEKKITVYREDGSKKGEYEYRKNGLKLKTIIYDKKGRIKKQWEYDRNGNRATQIEWYYEGNLKGKKMVTYYKNGVKDLERPIQTLDHDNNAFYNDLSWENHI